MAIADLEGIVIDVVLAYLVVLDSGFALDCFELACLLVENVFLSCKYEPFVRFDRFRIKDIIG
jgi:hypothetical protein